jgi:glucosamine--fructose-6-phosphate aminotransferase (isomerizing)
VNAAEAKPASEPGPPGELFLAEVREQPEALLRLLAHEADFEAVSAALAARAPSAVRLVGHGTSDAAATYGTYAFGLLPGWTALRDTISLTVYYGATFDLSDSVVIALSQSGRTPDVVEYVTRTRARGALTIALTNDPESGLAAAADVVIPLSAGPERSVAASKTYLNELAALALLAGGAAGRGQDVADGIRAVAELLADAMAPLEQAVSAPATALTYVGRMYVIGRGLEFATAREVALKLTETCRVAAEPLTATDLAHGPVAALDSLFPVWTIASHDESLPAVVEGAARVRQAGATLVASGPAAAEIADAAYRLPVPEPPLPILSPLLSVVPGQLFAAALARAKGLDADHPEGLSKITLAR